MHETKTVPDRRPAYYAVIPAQVRYDPELPPRAILLYGELTALAQAEGYCWASNAYLAALYGVSADTITRLAACLERRGYIRREDVRDPETNAVTGRKIWIADGNGPLRKNTDTPLQKCGGPLRKNADQNNIKFNKIPPVVPQPGDGARAAEAEREQGETAETPETLTGEPETAGAQEAAEPREPADERFEAFWLAYPARRGRKNGKAKARTAWKRLRVSARRYDAIMAGLEAYKQGDDVRRGYAVDAFRWLRDRRWEDECTPLNPDTPPDGLLPGEREEDYLWIPD